MVPLIQPFPWITAFTDRLGLSYHESKHLPRYLTSLIVSRTKTIRSMNALFTDNLSSRSMTRFLNESSLDVNSQRVVELQNHNETRWSQKGIAIIDDTLIHKTGKHIPHVYTFYDHAEERFVDAQCITTLHYADRKTNYALDYRLYVKQGEEGFKTKIQLAQELLAQALALGMPAQTIVFDAWYLCEEMVSFITSQSRMYIGACKSNLLIRWEGNRYISLDDYVKKISVWRPFSVNGRSPEVYTKQVHFKSIGDARLIVSREGKNIICLATNRTDHATKVIADYLLRWKVEDFYKNAKQHLGLEKCQVRDIEGIKRHWYLVFLAHSILKLGAAEGVLGNSILRSSIGQRVRRACIEALESFVLWVLETKSVSEVRDFMEGFIYRQT